MARLLDDARSAVKDDGVPGGPLVLGTLETTAALRMPDVLASFALAYPQVDMVVRTGTTASLIDDVLQYRLDGAFVAGPVRHEDLSTEVIFREEMVLVTARHIRSIAELAQSGSVKTIVFRIDVRIEHGWTACSRGMAYRSARHWNSAHSTPCSVVWLRASA